MRPVRASLRRPLRAALPALLILAGGTPFSPAVGTAGAGGWPDYAPDANAAREDVPELYRWNLDQLFSGDEAWESELAELEGEIEALGQYRGRLDDPRALTEALDLYFSLHDRTNHCTLYANLLRSTQLDDDRLASMETRSLARMDQLMQTAAFLRTGILGLSEEQIARAYQARPELEAHRSYVENLRRRRDRVRSPETEGVLGLLGDNLWAEIDLNEIPSPLEDTFGALLTDITWPTITDEEGNEVQMTLASYGRYRGSSDREVRKQAVAAMFATLHQFRHAFAATLGGQYEFNVALARARGYDTALEAYLDKDGLRTDVYENLISTINANLEPLHRYVELRRQVMGLDEVHLYDLYVPFVEDVESEVDFATAREMLLEALAPLGEEYGRLLEYGSDPANGWMDLYPNAAKRSGAFSASVYGRHPYVFMNYQNSMDDMFTLAHEFGHAVHSHLAMTHQPYSAFRYVPFLAEVASTCSEALVTDHLLAKVESDAERAALLVERAENIRTTIYRQTLFAEFERAVHRMVETGVPVTAEGLEKTYAELIRRYYGPSYALDEHDGMEWAYVPHFYYKYYVFTYATGLSSGIAIADRVRELGQPAVDGLLAMLSGGSSEAPLALLARAGVDLTQPAPIEAATRLLDETVRELEEILLAAGTK